MVHEDSQEQEEAVRRNHPAIIKREDSSTFKSSMLDQN